MCFVCYTHCQEATHSKFQWKSPFERLHGKQPTYEDLKVVGCLSFAVNLHPADKFDSRAKKCIFLGYTLSYKGYKLYDLQTKKIFHSGDVIFYANIFPFKGDLDPIGTSVQDNNTTIFHPIPTYAASDNYHFLFALVPRFKHIFHSICSSL